MGRKKQNNKKTNKKEQKEKTSKFTLPGEAKRWIEGTIMFLIALILTFSFFDKAGWAGKAIFEGIAYLIGRTVFAVPLIFITGGFIFLKARYKNFFWPTLLAILILILSTSAILEILFPGNEKGGLIGALLSWPVVGLFGVWVAQIIFATVMLLSLLIFWQLLKEPRQSRLSAALKPVEEETQPSLIKKIFAPQFKIKDIEPEIKDYHPPIQAKDVKAETEFKQKKALAVLPDLDYPLPPTDLLEMDRGTPTSGDTRANSAIIKKTLQNFDIPVECRR